MNDRRRFCLAPLAIGAVVLMASGCTAAEPFTESAQLRLTGGDVRRLAQDLDCAEVRVLEDDVYHYDAMTGFECVGVDEPWLTVRAYQSDASVGQVLVDWEGQFGDDLNVIAGANWFALGPPQRLAQIEDILEIGPSHGTSAPSPEPLTREQEGVRACTVGVVSIARNQVLGSPDGALAESYENVFPGIGREADEVAVTLTGRVTSEADFEYAIADLGPEIKSFCAETVE